MSEPHALQIVIQIAGAAALLIWAVRLVRTGVERGFAAPMRSWLRHSARNCESRRQNDHRNGLMI